MTQKHTRKSDPRNRKHAFCLDEIAFFIICALLTNKEPLPSIIDTPEDESCPTCIWNEEFNGLSLNSNIGAGLGSGEKHGAFMYQDPEGFGGATYNHGMESLILHYHNSVGLN